MRRFHPDRAPTIELRAELPFTALTTLSLVTLYLYDHEGPNIEMMQLATRLEQSGGRPPPAFNQIFGHGFGLRDSLAVLIEPGNAALASWPAFIQYLTDQHEPWYRALCELSVMSGLDFNQRPPPMETIDLRDQSTRLRFAQSIARPGDGATHEEIELLLEDPGGALKVMLLGVLNSFWSVLGSECGDDLADRLAEALDERRARISGTAPLRAFQQITGRVAPASERDRLERSEGLMFLLTSGLGAELSVSYMGNQAVVAFEPSRLRVDPYDDDVLLTARVFDALSNPLRIRLLRLLGERGEMFGLEIAEELGSPQATISNHLAALETAGLVGRRPGGRRIYYSLASSGIIQAHDVIEELRRMSESEEAT